MPSLEAGDVATAGSCAHGLRDSLVAAVDTWFTPARLSSLQSALETAAGRQLPARILRRAVIAYIEERAGGSA